MTRTNSIIGAMRRLSVICRMQRLKYQRRDRTRYVDDLKDAELRVEIKPNRGAGAAAM